VRESIAAGKEYLYINGNGLDYECFLPILSQEQPSGQVEDASARLKEVFLERLDKMKRNCLVTVATPLPRKPLSCRILDIGLTSSVP